MMPFADTDFVYVDPEHRKVVGPVEWSKTGNPKPLEKVEATEPAAADPQKRRPHGRLRKQYYPWGSYRSMKRIYRLEGKEKDAERTLTLDDAIARSMKEPYWD